MCIFSILLLITMLTAFHFLPCEHNGPTFSLDEEATPPKTIRHLNSDWFD